MASKKWNVPVELGLVWTYKVIFRIGRSGGKKTSIKHTAKVTVKMKDELIFHDRICLKTDQSFHWCMHSNYKDAEVSQGSLEKWTEHSKLPMI